MPRIDAVWGIDIGNCSLKALRCRAAEESGQLVADAFDYIEYPQILTQPGAEPTQLVQEALQQFLSRNNLRGTAVAVSVSGQNGLARFIKLPPVESRKIPDIVHYEARQQIPFDLNDVIWDYQRMGGGLEEEGFVLEAEIGLFAMKRDQVFRALEPFDNAAIGVDFVQLAPLALFNFLVFDQLTDLPPADEYDAENPPPSTVILSMGTDASDLVVTNGFRVWQRSIPIGGNHFTKALVKELKLTFAKAEHLKRNASTAADPKAVFQAMRQVFNDLLTEVQRSVGYYTTLDRAAKIQRVLAMGNAMKLPGLRRFLAQGLGFDVEVLEGYRALVGPEVLGAPAFQENHLCFSVCYGLALQALKMGSIRTNLIPKEIVKDRIIRSKKPWAVAAAAVVLLGCVINFASHSRALGTVDESRFQTAEQKAQAAAREAKDFKSAAGTAKSEMDATDKIGSSLVQNVEGRLRWLELLRAVNSCLPRDPEGKLPEELELRQQLHVLSMECQKLDSADEWVNKMKQEGWLASEGTSGGAESGTSAGGSGEGGSGASATPAGGSGGEGDATTWLITLQGYHYHNDPEAFRDNIGAQYLRNTLLSKLRAADVLLPTGAGDEKDRISLKDLGISNPVLVNPGRIVDEELQDPYAVREQEAARGTKSGMGTAPGARGMGTGGAMPMMGGAKPGGAGPAAGPAAMPGMMRGATGAMPRMSGRPGPASRSTTGGGRSATADTGDSATTFKVRRFDFLVQFLWKPTNSAERAKSKAAAEKAAASGEEAAGTAAGPGGAAAPASAATPDAAKGSPAGPGATPAAAPAAAASSGTAPPAAPGPK